ncbi:MAG: hypothetical protein R3322_08165 [Kiloniellales bacterium]|nr:hypothetical protein [Kiloniellales bacterium]
MKHWLAAVALSVATSLAIPAAAAEPGDPAAPSEAPSEAPGELARDGLEQLLRALESFVDMIPQYEMPEINENGDIIIRRKRDPAPAQQDDEGEEPVQTQT